MSPTLLRSVLYVPGSNPRALAKAPGLGCDALIIDLEDSVAPEAKEAARRQTGESLAGIPSGAPLRLVRINGLESPLWRDDLAAIVPQRPDGIVIPKVDDAPQLAPLVAELVPLEERNGLPPTPLWPMIETPRAVINAYAIACAPRAACLLLGSNDLAKGLHLPPEAGYDGLRLALQQTVLAARAAGVAVVDGVFADIRDADGFAAQCRAGALLGFDGKSIIHPAQVAPANAAFLPSQEALEQARRVVEGWRAARGRGEEICLVDGRLVERLHAQQAERLLSLWRAAGGTDGAAPEGRGESL